ncbi:MAG: TIGR02757 family protein [Acidobacteria bacterium]|nr:TIGR02757 family protein [Acidobacteriota bacterium]
MAAPARRVSSRSLSTAALARLRVELDRLHDGYNVPDSAADPVQFVRRYDDPRDREIVAALASGLAFGRLASVLASIERVLALIGSHPAAYLSSMDVRDARASLAPVVHRWTRGDDIVALLVVLRDLVDRFGSLEGAFLAGDDSSSEDVASGLEAFCAAACAVDVREAYGGARKDRLGVHYFFPRPSLGSACKRLNLFVRWMVRQDAVDPGGWSGVSRARLVIPLDTHTIRVGRCLRLTHYTSPGWRMAADITATLRRIDPVDPVRYDFSLCHMSMMGACGWGRPVANSQCPLRGFCRPAR